MRGSKRGFTLAELLTVLVILGLVTSIMAAISAPLLNATTQMQAKGDSLNTDVQGMYRMQRDLRQSDANDVFVCTASGSSCAAPSGSLASTSVLAIVTDKSSSGGWGFSSNDGTSAWTGFMIYYLAANTSGANNLKMKFVADGTLGIKSSSTVTAAKAAVAAASAIASSDAETVAAGVQQLLVSAQPSSQTIGLKLQAQSTVSGRTNYSTFESDTYARN